MQLSRILKQISSKSIEELSLAVYGGTWKHFVRFAQEFPWDVLTEGLAQPELTNVTRLEARFHTNPTFDEAIFPGQLSGLKLIIEERLQGFKHILSIDCN
jgi:hypothetical protein